MSVNLVLSKLDPGGYYDADTLAFHAVFQCLTNFIEKEHGGLDKYVEYVEWCEAENVNEPDVQRTNVNLYQWYQAFDKDIYWDLYAKPKEGVNVICPHDQLKKAIEVMGSWWT